MQYVIGLDLGTTCIKALVFDEEGCIRAEASRDDNLITPRKGWAEQDARSWMRLSAEAIREAVQLSGAQPKDIAAISVSSQGITIVPVDESFHPLSNAINWLDMRGEKELEEIASLGVEKIYSITGKNISSGGYSLVKLLWIRENLPEIYRRSAYFLLPHDYIIAHLCGTAATDHSMASATMLYDVPRQTWSDEILSAFDIDPKRLPKLMWSGEMAGTLTPDAAELLGLSPLTAVIVGGQDQKVAAYGAGLSAQTSTISMGTCEAYEFLFKNPPAHPKRALAAFSYVEPGKWTLEGCTNTAGAAIKWARDQIFLGLSYDDMNALAAQAQVGSGGVTFHPYLSGSGTPHNLEGNGVFGGLTLDVTRNDLARAIFEGIAYEARANLDAAKEAGVVSQNLVIFGGGSRSGPLCQILADVTGRSLTSFACPEMGAMGAGKLCAQSLGFSAFEESNRQGSKLWEPDPTRHKIYAELYDAYLDKMAGVEKL